MYFLTPSRKRMRKAVARGARRTFAEQVLRDPLSKQHIFAKLGTLVHSDMLVVCSSKTSSVAGVEGV